MSIKITGLSKQFGSQMALDQISFEANKGEILGFLGPNGAGKSTTMKIATGYLPATEGTVEICGLPVEGDAIATRKKLGYLPEHNPLYLDSYVHEYLRFVASTHGLWGKSAKRKVAEVVDLCGLSVEQNKKMQALSKGYRQRVGLAQTLIHDPEVLILDEPTTGLDPNQILEIRNVIRQASESKTVLFSSHIMQEVQALCDRVVIINKGKIVADDTVSNLLSKQQSQKKIILVFEQNIDSDLLLQINGIVDVSPKDIGQYVLSLQDDSDPRGEIFTLSSAQGWSLLEVKQDTDNMEDIFHQLTQG